MAGSSATARHALSMSRLRSILLPLTVMPRVVFCHPMPSHLAPAPHILPDGRRTRICLCPRHRRRWRPSSACRCRGCSLSARPFPYNGEVVWSVCPCPLFSQGPTRGAARKCCPALCPLRRGQAAVPLPPPSTPGTRGSSVSWRI